LQCLVYTLGISQQTVRVLDGLRKQRNSTDYDGEMVTEALLDECLKQAKVLLSMAESKLS